MRRPRSEVRGQRSADRGSARIRDGMTLFEVVLALAIFLGAGAALSQLYSVGSRAAIQARLQSQAVIHAQSKMNEIAAGVLPVDTMTSQMFEDPDLEAWTWSSIVGPGPHPDLVAVQVTVERHAAGDMGRISYSLSRYVRDPQLFLDAAIYQAVNSSAGTTAP